MKKVFQAALASLILWSLLIPAQTLSGQENFDDLFEQMMKEFFPKDLQNEIESLRKESGKSNQSFYKNDPRFLEIKRKEILRRKKDLEEKQHTSSLQTFRPLTRVAARSVVALYKSEEKKTPSSQLAFATAITESILVTKADEIKDLEVVKCVDHSGSTFEAKVVHRNQRNDLALLEVTGRKLTPIRIESEQPDLGAFLVTTSNQADPVAVGTLAVRTRSIIGKNRGFLGVEPQPGTKGVLINAVTPRSAAYRAGVQVGDQVTLIDRIKTETVADLVREIGAKKKGDTVKLTVIRDGKTIELNANLDGRSIRGERAARFEMMKRLGAVLSRRNDEFPAVFEHDTPILPNQCGSPLLDLDGNAVGINIARAGRTSSYALPIELVKRIVKEAT